MKIFLSIGILLLIGFILWFLIPGVVSYVDGHEPFVRIWIMAISSLISLAAIVVALFKEDLRAKIIKPILAVSKNNVLEEMTQQSVKKVLEAIEYSYKVKISNTGRISANKVEVFLEEMSYKSQDVHVPVEIETEGLPINWRSSNVGQILIPIHTGKTINLFKLLPPENESTPDQTNPEIKSQCRIQVGEKTHNIEPGKCEWTLKYSIYSDNAKPIKLELSINWNGVWQSRLAEMNKICSVKEVINA